MLQALLFWVFNEDCEIMFHLNAQRRRYFVNDQELNRNLFFLNPCKYYFDSCKNVLMTFHKASTVKIR